MAILRRKLAAVSSAKEERDVIAQIQALQQVRVYFSTNTFILLKYALYCFSPGARLY